MLKRLLCLLLTLLFYADYAQAQAYEPGWLVRTNGDTLRGELENGFWLEPPTFVRYRRTPESPSELFPARQLRAVSFKGGRYFRHEVLRLDRAAEVRLQDLKRGNYVNMQPDSVLAEVLLSGPVELLRVVRPGATQFVLRRPGRPDLSLSERHYLSDGPDINRIIDGNNYRNQLMLYFADCPAAVSLAERIPYTAAGLAEVAQAYAISCAPGKQPAQSWLSQAVPRRKGAFQAGVLAGVRYNHMASPSFVLTEGCHDCQVHPFGGLYAELLQPSRITAFYGEFSLSSFHNQGTYTLGFDATGKRIYTVFDFRALLFTARLGVRYFVPLRHDRQIMLGFSYEHNEVLGLSLTGNGSPDPSTAGEAYASPTLLPDLMLGWRCQRFTASIDGQLYHSNSDSNALYNFFLGSSWATRLGLSYRLGRNPDKLAHNHN
ncbi:hypothetical protein [Hymenobacter sp. BRD67]|uniref:hypothetical protein n=1 Tax=Hymenobacter sp. BRD67 TaxID=2675877 RepID=UPI001566FB18|nr:hypothetical protein [Hymenobacter sp. BRD67]QKG54143.1 hypothetical protein GKZ67_18010 [Hymenobacter sp. BRD67]